MWWARTLALSSVLLLAGGAAGHDKPLEPACADGVPRLDDGKCPINDAPGRASPVIDVAVPPAVDGDEAASVAASAAAMGNTPVADDGPRPVGWLDAVEQLPPINVEESSWVVDFAEVRRRLCRVVSLLSSLRPCLSAWYCEGADGRAGARAEPALQLDQEEYHLLPARRDHPRNSGVGDEHTSQPAALALLQPPRAPSALPRMGIQTRQRCRRVRSHERTVLRGGR